MATAFDVIEVFTFDEAARALVFDQTGRMVPALCNRLTADGSAYHDWLDVLRKAASEEVGALHISIYEDDPEKKSYIQRGHFREWCELRNIRPGFLFSGGEVRGGADESASAGKVTIAERRRQALMIAIAAAGYEAMSIPTGGKAAVKKACLIEAGLFTDSTFDKAWKSAAADKKLKMKDSDKFANR